jgi:hypothetical protein
MRRLAQKLAIPGALAFSACSAPNPGMDAGADAGPTPNDGGHNDGGFDAGYDAGVPDSGVPDGGHRDAGDLGPCPISSPGNPMNATFTEDSGVRCECVPFFQMDGGFGECCDEDIGNPCGICCYNPKDADGGRAYYGDDGGIVYGVIDAGVQAWCLC